MSSNNTSVPVTTAAFQTALLHLVNEVLPTLRLSHTQWQPVGLHTLLFENGRLDSLAVLHLIGAIEELTAQPVPDHLVSMKHFQSIQTITDSFCPLPS
jgi:acyl carrier protein